MIKKKNTAAPPTTYVPSVPFPVDGKTLRPLSPPFSPKVAQDCPHRANQLSYSASTRLDLLP